MGLKEQKSITNIINMAGLIFFMFDNVIYNRTLWCRSYTSITAPHELSSVSRGLGIFALWALDT